jgi:hypothetical protein
LTASAAEPAAILEALAALADALSKLSFGCSEMAATDAATLALLIADNTALVDALI